jgi:hypothetical protein
LLKGAQQRDIPRCGRRLDQGIVNIVIGEILLARILLAARRHHLPRFSHLLRERDSRRRIRRDPGPRDDDATTMPATIKITPGRMLPHEFTHELHFVHTDGMRLHRPRPLANLYFGINPVTSWC